jgi:6-phosphofructokinase 1
MAIRKSRIGVLTGGGDCAGLNPAIKWVTKGLLDKDLSRLFRGKFEVVGIRNGWAGLVDGKPMQRGLNKDHYWILDESTVRTWDRLGGTNLGSSRTNPLKDKDVLQAVIQNIEKNNFEAIVAIGGEDTQSVAEGLRQQGVNVVGIPKTIDKDLRGTDYTLGFSTAVEVIRQEIGRLRTTAGSHQRLFVVETMGRHAGHLALQGGIAGGACMTLIPEVDFEMEKVLEILKKRKGSGARYDILVVAEGAKPVSRTYEVVQNRDKDAFGHVTLGGIGEQIKDAIKADGFTEVRCVVLSHLQRGGAPNGQDVRMGRAFGLAAAELIHSGSFGNMVALRDNRIVSLPFTEAIQRNEKGEIILNLVNVEMEYDEKRYIAKRRALNTKFM